MQLGLRTLERLRLQLLPLRRLGPRMLARRLRRTLHLPRLSKLHVLAHMFASQRFLTATAATLIFSRGAEKEQLWGLICSLQLGVR